MLREKKIHSPKICHNDKQWRTGVAMVAVWRSRLKASFKIALMLCRMLEESGNLGFHIRSSK